jgi:cell division protein ZapA (FtsZ GTPase activity inhibitor)
MAESVKVTILGVEYSLRTNDEQLLRALASDVDAELTELQTKLPTQPPAKLAVLTALNLAEKLAHSRGNEIREIERLTDEINALADSLESVLNQV